MPGNPAEKKDQIGTCTRITDRGGKHTISRNRRLGIRKETVKVLLIPVQGRLGQRRRIRKILHAARLSTEKTLKGGTDLERIPSQIMARPAGRRGSDAAVETNPLGRIQCCARFRIRIATQGSQASQHTGAYYRPGGWSPADDAKA